MRFTLYRLELVRAALAWFEKRSQAAAAVAMGVVLVVAGLILLPGLGSYGLFEPQERQVADKEAPGPELAAKQEAAEAVKAKAAADQKDAKDKQKAEKAEKEKAAAKEKADKAEKNEHAKPASAPPPPAPDEDCSYQPKKEATARALSGDAAAWGRDTFGDSDAGRRLPLALLGLVTVLALAATTLRLATPRAAVLSALVALSMPLLVLQSRTLTSEIGTACGSALIVYAGVALAELCFKRAPIWLVLGDGAVAAACGYWGLEIGFAGGGGLLGVAVPLGAVALAGGLGAGAFVFAGRAARWLGIVSVGGVHKRFRVGRDESLRFDGAWRGTVALGALLGALAALALIAYDIYTWKDPIAGSAVPQRTIFGSVLTSSNCWSSNLGGLWRQDEDMRIIFDSTWEQIAYGTYPWGLIAPIAIAWLCASADPRRRRLGTITLAWAGLSWIATEAFQRKVGFCLWGGFPALAIALGAWLDGVVESTLAAPPAWDKPTIRDAIPKGALLIGLFALLAVLDIGKDMQEFSDKLSSLLIANQSAAGGVSSTANGPLPYPTDAHVLVFPARVLVLSLGMMIATGIASTMFAWHDTDAFRRRAASLCIAGAIGSTLLMAAFWSFGWEPALADHLSSKPLFDTFTDLAKQGDQLVVMGDLGDAPHDYAPDAQVEVVAGRPEIVAAIGRPNRVFAIAPQTELCQLHREIGGKPYFVLDQTARSLLLSNREEGGRDENPLRFAIVHKEPTDIPVRLPIDKKTGKRVRVVWDNKIELLGWDMPASVGRSDKMTVTTYYKVLGSVGGSWKALYHFDTNGSRFNGDHPPINDRCQTSTWQPGDYIIDTFTVVAGNTASPKGGYEVWTGFFTGSAPNFKNMPISEAPGDMRDTGNTDRVKITTLELE